MSSTPSPTDAVLETPRLLLQQWRPEDWSAFKPIATNPEVMRYINGGIPWSDERIRDFVSRQIALYQERGHCRWKLTGKTSGALCGFCGVGRFHEFPDPEIGWWLAPNYWGNGFATEAARAALDDAFRRVAIPRIVSIAHRENSASIRIMQKLGLAFEADFENEGLPLRRYAIHLPAYLATRSRTS